MYADAWNYCFFFHLVDYEAYACKIDLRQGDELYGALLMLYEPEFSILI